MKTLLLTLTLATLSLASAQVRNPVTLGPNSTYEINAQDITTRPAILDVNKDELWSITFSTTVTDAITVKDGLLTLQLRGNTVVLGALQTSGTWPLVIIRDDGSRANFLLRLHPSTGGNVRSVLVKDPSQDADVTADPIQATPTASAAPVAPVRPTRSVQPAVPAAPSAPTAPPLTTIAPTPLPSPTTTDPAGAALSLSVTATKTLTGTSLYYRLSNPTTRTYVLDERTLRITGPDGKAITVSAPRSSVTVSAGGTTFGTLTLPQLGNDALTLSWNATGWPGATPATLQGTIPLK